MSAEITISVQIAPEAAERIAELGLQREFEQMLDHARQTIPHVSRIEVTAPPRYDLGGDPLVFLEAFVTAPGSTEARMKLERGYDEWVWSIFPQELYHHFVLHISPRVANGR
jgi:hypothetical protein